MEEALHLFGEMLEIGEKPNAIAVNNMLAAFARDAPNFWKHAQAIFEVRSIRRGPFPGRFWRCCHLIFVLECRRLIAALGVMVNNSQLL